MKSLLCAAVCSVGFLGSVCVAPALAQGAGQAQIQPLSIGDQAPPLYISKWLKGDPVNEFEPGHVYVVEFWATWCGPCIAGMPHVSELQRKYKDDVTVIGVNIWERDTDAVPGWMEDRGEKPSGNELMDYTVAMQADTRMAEEWMERAGRNGIPSAFIVDRAGEIAWVGHPGSMDEPLKQVVEGKWDTAAAAREQAKEKAEERRREREMERFQARAAEELEALSSAKTPEQRIDAIEGVLSMDPPAAFASRFVSQGFTTLAMEMEQPEKACEFIDSQRKHIWDSPMDLNRYAWDILTEEAFADARDTDLAMEMGMRAHELSGEKDGMIIDTVARAYFMKAIDLQRLAVEHSNQSMKASIESQLEIYEKAYSQQPE